MLPEVESIFLRLRSILRKHAERLSVTADRPGRYCLEGKAGPAAVQAWGGKVRRAQIPVAWVEIGRSYVSYHLMGMYGNSAVRDGMSKGLKARMQGKTCFNFKTEDEALFKELEQVTDLGVNGFRDAGFITDQ